MTDLHINRMSRHTPNTVAVAFLFFSTGNHWQGGKNYYRALFGAIDADPARRVQIFAFLGKRTDPNEFKFPDSVICIRASALDRLSPAWLFDRVCKRLLGRTPLLTRALRKQGIQVVSHCDPRDSSTFPCIAWIPDFQHVHLPHFFKSEELVARDLQFKMVLEHSDRVIVSSNAAREDLERFSPAHVDKGRVLQFCSVRPELKHDDDDIERLYGLHAPYFYIPNQFWAHKNHGIAVEALAILRARRPDVQIICSGALSDYRNPMHVMELKRRIDELGLTEHFRLLGLIPYAHIARLIARSAAVINPSYFEGWSTTVEESKALGAPLLLSDLRVHREQCGSNEALFFDPNDSNSLVQCMDQVLTGAWPAAQVDRAAVAQDRYMEQRIAFARRYQEIVLELVG